MPVVSAARSLMQKHQNQTVGRSSSHFNSFLQILQPRWQTHLDRIQKFKIKTLFGVPVLSVQLEGGAWLRAAWRPNAQKETTHYQLQSAMRHAVWKQISKWKVAHRPNQKCVRCHQLQHLQADHDVLSFQTLCTTFLQGRTPPVTFDYHPLGRKFQAKHRQFKCQWQKYHQKHCSLQWLCRSCNVTKKKWQNEVNIN